MVFKAVVLLLVLFYRFSLSLAFMVPNTSLNLKPSQLYSSFYNDFENFESGDNDDLDDEDEDEDEDEEDDDYEDGLSVSLDDGSVADFRSRMGSLFGDSNVISAGENVDEFIRKVTKADAKDNDWARPLSSDSKLKGGIVLLGNPSKFCADFGSSVPSPALLSKFGLTLPPPADLGPDRRADLLPVVCILDRHPLRGSIGVLLNRRTGYLLGDLEQQQQGVPPPPPKLGAFMIQPLWFGGTSSGGNEESSMSGLDMLHLCPGVNGAKKLTDDGLYWGGDPTHAQEAMNNPNLDRIFTGFDFKFFVQSTRWLPLQLEKEIRDGTWVCAEVSKEVLFKPRDRMGTRRAKPLWTEIMELMGGEYRAIRDQLYDDDASFP
jgi:Uncharacterized ACR, COG1678